MPDIADVFEAPAVAPPAPEPAQPAPSPPSPAAVPPVPTPPEPEPVQSAMPEPLPAPAPEDLLEDAPREASEAPVRIARAMPPPSPPPQPAPAPRPPAERPKRSRGSLDSEVKNLGFTNFEAIQDEIAPYLLEIRKYVERRWIEMLLTRYSGTKPALAVIDCAIRPDGVIESTATVGNAEDPGLRGPVPPGHRARRPLPPVSVSGARYLPGARILRYDGPSGFCSGKEMQ